MNPLASGMMAPLVASVLVHALALAAVSGLSPRTARPTANVDYYVHAPRAIESRQLPSPPPDRPDDPRAPRRTAPAGPSLSRHLESMSAGVAMPEVSWSPVGDPFAASPRAASLAESSPVAFAGMGAILAPSVVYVVDGSGPMVSSLPLVMDELRRSLRDLDPSQTFNVIIFRDRSTTGTPSRYEEFAPELVPATREQITRASRFLAGIQAEGASNPSDGLRRALSHRPAVVFLLARSIRRSGERAQWGEGLDAILAELNRLNPADPRTGARPVQIKTLQFLEEDPSGTMQAIGEIHGGDDGYRVLTLDEIQGR